MSLIVLEHASLAFGSQIVLRDVSLRLGERDRIGLVGPNGAGKSTLLKVLMQQQASDTGSVRTARHCRIGYLPQDVQELAGDTLLGSVLGTVPGRGEIQHQLGEIEAALELTTDADEQMTLAMRLAELGEALERFELFYSERQAIRILRGLGFEELDLNRPTGELSGGWKMRAALAGLLFQQPDALFLDEPTNHLDLPSVLWLGGFLRELRGALVLICHDRDFLNRHVERIWSFEPEGLRSYVGNYDSYVTQRQQEEEVLSARVKNRERELKRTERFVERFKAKATKARQAQSRARRVKRLQAELAADRPIQVRRELRFRFPDVERTGRDVIMLEGVSKAFGENRLYDGLTKGVYAGERIAIVGRNGTGKTTLLRLMARELPPDAGTIRYGSNVRLGYYAQHHNDQLTDSLTVLDEVRYAAPAASESFVRGVCGAFLFSKDEVEKPIAVLSGGERARVLLAKLLANPGNVLLMDEPTNHLDVAAAEALAEALALFGGTLVFVSHNTAFVDHLATAIWDIEGGELLEYPGTLAEYLTQRAAAEEADKPAKPRPTRTKPNAEPTPKPKQKQKQKQKQKPKPKPKQKLPKPKPEPEQEQKPPSDRRRRRRKRGPSEPADPELRQRVEGLQGDLKELESTLADPELFSDQTLFGETLRQYREVERELEQLQNRLTRRGASKEAT